MTGRKQAEKNFKFGLHRSVQVGKDIVRFSFGQTVYVRKYSGLGTNKPVRATPMASL